MELQDDRRCQSSTGALWRAFVDANVPTKAHRNVSQNILSFRKKRRGPYLVTTRTILIGSAHGIDISTILEIAYPFTPKLVRRRRINHLKHAFQQTRQLSALPLEVRPIAWLKKRRSKVLHKLRMLLDGSPGTAEGEHSIVELKPEEHVVLCTSS